MTIPRGQARETILQSAEGLVRKCGASAVTVEAVAKAAGSAKGLVHYHFKTKLGLLGAVLDRLAQARTRAWLTALEPRAAQSAAERSWNLLTDESVNGITLAWHTLLQSGDVFADQPVKNVVNEFSRSLGNALVRLLKEDMRLVPTVPNEEIGWFMTAVIDGIGLQLLAGASEQELQEAYATAWLGVLSLTTPA